MATWQIETLKYQNNADKIVTQAHWRCFGSAEADGKLYTADENGSIALDGITADAAGFIAYADLSESKCLEWVYAKLNKNEIETKVADALTASASSPIKSGTPWITEAN